MLLLSIALWCVVIFSLRVAFWGNPLWTFLRRADDDLRARCQAIVARKRAVLQEEELRFMRHFSHLTLLELGAFLLELVMLLWVWGLGIMPWLALGLLVKNVAMIGVSVVLTRSRMDNEGRIFDSLLALPKWMVTADRGSAFISGIGCLIIFLEINGVLPW